MRDQVILAAVVVISAASIVTALGVVWLCAHATHVAAVLRQTAIASVELQDAATAAVADALLRIEEAAADAKDAALEAKKAAERTSESVHVGTELGYQAAESNRRMEAGAALIAHDLSAAHGRADAAEGPHGAAADAASRTEQ